MFFKQMRFIIDNWSKREWKSWTAKWGAMRHPTDQSQLEAAITPRAAGTVEEGRPLSDRSWNHSKDCWPGDQ